MKSRICAFLFVSVVLAGLAPLAVPQPAGKTPGDKDKAALKGKWKIVHAVHNGKKVKDRIGELLIFDGDKFHFVKPSDTGKPVQGSIVAIEAENIPKTIDLVLPGAADPALCIYEIDGNDLKLSLNDTGTKDHPRDFTGKKYVALTLKRYGAGDLEREKIQGKWKVARVDSPGKEDRLLQGMTAVVADDKLTINKPGETSTTIKILALDPGKDPKTILCLQRGQRTATAGIYELKTDEFRICLADPGSGDFPMDFSGKTSAVLTLKRFGPADDDKESLQGRWQVVAAADKSKEVRVGMKAAFDGDTFRIGDTGVNATIVAVEPHKDQNIPTGIDLRYEGQKDAAPGIYQLNGAELRICLAKPGAAERPKTFSDKHRFITLRRLVVDDAQSLQGKWEVVAIERDGKELVKEHIHQTPKENDKEKANKEKGQKENDKENAKKEKETPPDWLPDPKLAAKLTQTARFGNYQVSLPKDVAEVKGLPSAPGVKMAVWHRGEEFIFVVVMVSDKKAVAEAGTDMGQFLSTQAKKDLQALPKGTIEVGKPAMGEVSGMKFARVSLTITTKEGNGSGYCYATTTGNEVILVEMVSRGDDTRLMETIMGTFMRKASRGAQSMIFFGNRVKYFEGYDVANDTFFTVDASKRPRTIDLIDKWDPEKAMLGIFELTVDKSRGDTLKLCLARQTSYPSVMTKENGKGRDKDGKEKELELFDESEWDRPTEFLSSKTDTVIYLKRVRIEAGDLFAFRDDKKYLDPEQDWLKLRKIMTLLQIYETDKKMFPPAAICNDKGELLLSWRVALLPYMGQNRLYTEFKLDEPWDSDHNKKLIEKIPDLYVMPIAKAKLGETHYRLLGGGGAGFDLVKGTKKSEIVDGPDTTLALVQAAEAVPWTKPEVLTYDPKGPMPEFAEFYGDGKFLGAFFDGHLHLFNTRAISQKTMRALITKAGREPGPFDLGGLEQKVEVPSKLELSSWSADQKLLVKLTQSANLGKHRFSLPDGLLSVNLKDTLPPNVKTYAWVGTSLGVVAVVDANEKTVGAARTDLRKFLSDALPVTAVTGGWSNTNVGKTEKGRLDGVEFTRVAWSARTKEGVAVSGYAFVAVDGNELLFIMMGSDRSENRLMETIMATFRSTPDAKKPG